MSASIVSKWENHRSTNRENRVPNVEDKQNLGRLNKKIYQVSYLYDGVWEHANCWRMYRNTNETMHRFTVKYIMSHVFSFFTLSINKGKEIHSFKLRVQSQEGIRSETGNTSFICFWVQMDHHLLQLKPKISKSPPY